MATYVIADHSGDHFYGSGKDFSATDVKDAIQYATLYGANATIDKNGLDAVAVRLPDADDIVEVAPNLNRYVVRVQGGRYYRENDGLTKWSKLATRYATEAKASDVAHAVDGRVDTYYDYESDSEKLGRLADEARESLYVIERGIKARKLAMQAASALARLKDMGENANNSADIIDILERNINY